MSDSKGQPSAAPIQKGMPSGSGFQGRRQGPRGRQGWQGLCVCVCVCVSGRVCEGVSVSLCICIYVHVCACVCVCLYMCACVCVSVCVGLWGCVWMGMCLWEDLPVRLFWAGGPTSEPTLWSCHGGLSAPVSALSPPDLPAGRPRSRPPPTPGRSILGQAVPSPKR